MPNPKWTPAEWVENRNGSPWSLDDAAWDIKDTTKKNTALWKAAVKYSEAMAEFEDQLESLGFQFG